MDAADRPGVVERIAVHGEDVGILAWRGAQTIEEVRALALPPEALLRRHAPIVRCDDRGRVLTSPVTLGGGVAVEAVDRLVRDARQALSRPITVPGQAAAIAKNLFVLSEVHGRAADPVVVELLAAFRAALRDADLADVLERQLRYGATLAGATGPLLYEEMHKLVSLCDAVHALRRLGFSADPALISQFEAAVRARFAAERGMANMAAVHLVQAWSRSLWWYAENLLRSTRP